MEKQKTLFDIAHENTLALMEEFMVAKRNMTNSLNFIVERGLEGAKMEYEVSKIEGVPYEKLSGLAKQVANNPELEVTKKFVIRDIVEKATCDEYEGSISDTGIFEGAKPQEDEKDIDLEFVSTEEKTSKPAKTRRKWKAIQRVKTDECELKIEVASLSKRDQKALER